MNLRIGTSGWSYPKGAGTWNGIFYPRGRKVDQLAFYAEHFDTVEVNSTFYRIPQASVCRSWVRRTRPSFEFSLKLYQKFTHPQMFRKATGQQDATVRPADVDEFRTAIEPVARAARLGALLAQFPPSFRNTDESCDYLARLLGAFRDYRVAVELRHRSWSDDLGRTLELLNGFSAAWAQIDEPKFRFSIRQNYLPNVTGFYYMRLHGRNAQKWWRHDTADDRYDYLYSRDELTPFAETADAARRLVRKMYLYMNNHYSAKAVANAAMLRNQLGIPVPGEYPPEFIERYPELAGIVTVSGRRPAQQPLVTPS